MQLLLITSPLSWAARRHRVLWCTNDASRSINRASAEFLTDHIHPPAAHHGSDGLIKCTETPWSNVQFQRGGRPSRPEFEGVFVGEGESVNFARVNVSTPF